MKTADFASTRRCVLQRIGKANRAKDMREKISHIHQPVVERKSERLEEPLESSALEGHPFLHRPIILFGGEVVKTVDWNAIDDVREADSFEKEEKNDGVMIRLIEKQRFKICGGHHAWEADLGKTDLSEFVHEFAASPEGVETRETMGIKDVSEVSAKQAVEFVLRMAKKYFKYNMTGNTHGDLGRREDGMSPAQILREGERLMGNPDWDGNGVCRHFAIIVEQLFENIKRLQAQNGLNDAYLIAVRGDSYETAEDINEPHHRGRAGHAWNRFFQKNKQDVWQVAEIDPTYFIDGLQFDFSAERGERAVLSLVQTYVWEHFGELPAKEVAAGLANLFTAAKPFFDALAQPHSSYSERKKSNKKKKVYAWRLAQIVASAVYGTNSSQADKRSELLSAVPGWYEEYLQKVMRLPNDLYPSDMRLDWIFEALLSKLSSGPEKDPIIERYVRHGYPRHKGPGVLENIRYMLAQMGHSKPATVDLRLIAKKAVQRSSVEEIVEHMQILIEIGLEHMDIAKLLYKGRGKRRFIKNYMSREELTPGQQILCDAMLENEEFQRDIREDPEIRFLFRGLRPHLLAPFDPTEHDSDIREYVYMIERSKYLPKYVRRYVRERYNKSSFACLGGEDFNDVMKMVDHILAEMDSKFYRRANDLLSDDARLRWFDDLYDYIKHKKPLPDALAERLNLVM